MSTNNIIPYSLINQDRLVNNFIKLAKIDSASISNTKVFPSSEGQKTIAKILVEELKNIGLSDVNCDNNYVVTGTLPANPVNIKYRNTIAFLAHMDTSADSPTININPIIHKRYTKGDIILKENTIIPETELKKYIGEDIITSDGTTLLGADDKAGIAEILEALWVLKENPSIHHPTIKIAFTPDEETGEFISNFDIKSFNADSAYTVDGIIGHHLETATFNAFNITINIKGYNVHPGDAKNRMINSNKIAADIVKNLPDNQSPEHTSGMEGYYHVSNIKSDVASASMNLLIRDFDYDNAIKRLEYIKNLATTLEKAYPGSSIKVVSKEAYRNMKTYLDQSPQVLEYATQGIKRTYEHLGHKNFIVNQQAIRGGTDGATLSSMGLPTPNIDAGINNAHAKNEFISVQSMKICTANILNIIMVWAENSIK